MQSKEIDSFQDVPTGEYPKVPIIVMYEQPTDYPDHYVLRLWDVDKPTKYVILRTSYEDALECVPSAMVMLGNAYEDDPKIVNVFI